MNATQLLHNLGQSLWLDNITRDLLNNGTLKRYIDELSVTGLTSNPAIFVISWNELLAVIAAKSTALKQAA
jgi:transaldolase